MRARAEPAVISLGATVADRSGKALTRLRGATLKEKIVMVTTAVTLTAGIAGTAYAVKHWDDQAPATHAQVGYNYFRQAKHARANYRHLMNKSAGYNKGGGVSGKWKSGEKKFTKKRGVTAIFWYGEPAIMTNDGRVVEIWSANGDWEPLQYDADDFFADNGPGVNDRYDMDQQDLANWLDEQDRLEGSEFGESKAANAAMRDLAKAYPRPYKAQAALQDKYEIPVEKKFLEGSSSTIVNKVDGVVVFQAHTGATGVPIEIIRSVVICAFKLGARTQWGMGYFAQGCFITSHHGTSIGGQTVSEIRWVTANGVQTGVFGSAQIEHGFVHGDVIAIPAPSTMPQPKNLKIGMANVGNAVIVCDPAPTHDRLKTMTPATIVGTEQSLIGGKTVVTFRYHIATTSGSSGCPAILVSAGGGIAVGGTHIGTGESGAVCQGFDQPLLDYLLRQTKMQRVLGIEQKDDEVKVPVVEKSVTATIGGVKSTAVLPQSLEVKRNMCTFAGCKFSMAGAVFPHGSRVCYNDTKCFKFNSGGICHFTHTGTPKGRGAGRCAVAGCKVPKSILAEKPKHCPVCSETADWKACTQKGVHHATLRKKVSGSADPQPLNQSGSPAPVASPRGLT